MRRPWTILANFVPWENKVDNIKLKGGGTSRAYALARLDRDRPDLAQRVLSGELSANAAAIEAGFS